MKLLYHSLAYTVVFRRLNMRLVFKEMIANPFMMALGHGVVGTDALSPLSASDAVLGMGLSAKTWRIA